MGRFVEGDIAGLYGGLRLYLILLWTRDQTHLAPAFPTSALRKKATAGDGPTTSANVKRLGPARAAPTSDLPPAFVHVRIRQVTTALSPV